MRLFHAPTRREVLLASGTLFAWAHLPKLAHAEGRDPRFLAIILRGALDGLATVAPVGDPDWTALRGDNALMPNGKTPPLKLTDFFALNPAMPNLHRLFKANQAIVIHACATPYRERSHFDGQDLLESGLPKPAVSDSGWLNRALTSLAPGGRVDPRANKAFAVGPVTRRSWCADRRRSCRGRRSACSRRAPTPCNACSISIAIPTPSSLARSTKAPGSLPSSIPERWRKKLAARARRKYAVILPKPPAPPRDSWPNRTDRASARSRSTAGIPTTTRVSLKGVCHSCLVHSMARSPRSKQASGRHGVKPWSLWSPSSAVPARINGTDGTDHGTATVALLVGGALKGGRVVADWPGLKPTNLYENRDLKPTTDLRAVLKGLLKDHLRADERMLADNVFPGSKDVKPLAGLVG